MIELDIRWDGTAPGLAEHRLSIGSFSRPLNTLLAAARRTANNILRESSDRKESDRGRWADEANRIDIQIVSLSEGSTMPSCVVAVAPPPFPQDLLFPEQLAEDTIDRLLFDIERESRGIQRNRGIRDYFRQLPPGITSQDYVLRVNGIVKREVHFGEVAIASDLTEAPYLIEVTGNVIGVGWDPGKHFVRIKESDSSASEMTLTATATQVNSALEFRESFVRVLVLVTLAGRKLLRIQQAHESHIRLDVDSFVFEKWHELMARLAQ